jgi:hypothetical protein
MPTITRNCAQCGVEFTRYFKKSVLANGMGLYCSLACSGKARQTKRVERTCENCGKVFQFRNSPSRTDRGVFCSISCSATVRSKRHGHAADSNTTRTYTTWAAMLQRCENPKSHKFYRYGAVGITVCDEWHDFHTFLRDMGERPENCTIDRIDGTLGYFKENCRWATSREQQRNLKSNVWVSYEGKQWVLSDLAKHLGLDNMTLKYRMKHWPESDWFRKAEQGRRLCNRS